MRKRNRSQDYSRYCKSWICSQVDTSQTSNEKVLYAVDELKDLLARGHL
jgi:hypothetical protein